MTNTRFSGVLKSFFQPLRRTMFGGAGLALFTRCAGSAVKFSLAAACFLILGLGNRVQAAAFTFNGLGADGNFTTTLNWVGTAPANQNGNDFTYAVASGGQTNLTDNFTGNLYSQTFAAGCVPLTISETLQELQGGNPYFVQNLSTNLQTLTGTLGVFAGSSSFNSSNGPLSLGALTIHNDISNPVNIILDGAANGTVNASTTGEIQVSSLLDNPVPTSTVTYAANLPASAATGSEGRPQGYALMMGTARCATNQKYASGEQRSGV